MYISLCQRLGTSNDFHTGDFRGFHAYIHNLHKLLDLVIIFEVTSKIISESENNSV